MNAEDISNKQGIMAITLFIMGSTLILGAGAQAKQAVWVALLIAVAIAVPVLFIYARLLSMFDGKKSEMLEAIAHSNVKLMRIRGGQTATVGQGWQSCISSRKYVNL